MNTLEIDQFATLKMRKFVRNLKDPTAGPDSRELGELRRIVEEIDPTSRWLRSDMLKLLPAHLMARQAALDWQAAEAAYQAEYRSMFWRTLGPIFASFIFIPCAIAIHLSNSLLWPMTIAIVVYLVVIGVAYPRSRFWLLDKISEHGVEV